MSLPLALAGDPQDLLLDSSNDLVIVNGDLAFSFGIAAVAQACRIAIQIFAGEWFLNLDVGIPYWQTILAQKPEVAVPAAQIAFRGELEAVQGVLDVPLCSVIYVGATRQLQVTWQVTTGLGDTPVDTIAISIATGVLAA